MLGASTSGRIVIRTSETVGNTFTVRRSALHAYLRACRARLLAQALWGES